MSSPLKKQKYYYEDYTHQSTISKGAYKTSKKVARKYKKQSLKISHKKNPFVVFLGLLLLGAYGYYVCPYNFQNYFRPLFLNKFLNRNITLDVKDFIQPSLEYTKNSYMLGDYIFALKAKDSKQLTNIRMLGELTSTKLKLLELFKNYSNLEPAVFVWDYSSGKGIEINANESYPSASIIKIPIAFELMRLIDETSKTNAPIKLSDKMLYTEDFKTLGSGHLQYTQTDVLYTINHLAHIMIADSDNSATNMILYKIGGLDGFNKAIRNTGLDVTTMGGWLPDLEGTNKITAKEISTILYNIDNPNFINPKYKPILKEYLLSTKNTHLIKEKLPQKAMVFHKTGNIGSMIGDSGIVYTENGKKYIVTILVKRPHNDYRAKILIQDASLIIYDDIKNL